MNALPVAANNTLCSFIRSSESSTPRRASLPLGLWSLLLGPFLLASSAIHANVFQESNGIVIMEVESEAPTSQWSEEQSVGGFKGSGYYVWRGDQFFNPADAGRGTIQYRFRINTPGNYEMRWRSYIAHGNLGSDYNDSWARFPTGSNINGQHGLNGWTKVYQGHLNEWSWDALTVDFVGEKIRQFFNAGEHVMEISGRSFGHAIDRIALYRYEDMDFNPSRFSDLPESARSGAQPQPVAVAEPEIAPVEVVVVEPEVVAEPVAEPDSSNDVVNDEPAPQDSPVITDLQVYYSTAAEVFWGRGDANIVSYDIFLDGQYIDSSSGTSYFFDSLSPSSSYTFQLQSVSASGQISATAARTFETASAGGDGGGATTADATAAVDGTSNAGVTAPQGASIVVYSATAAELFWDRASAAEGVVGVDVYRDGALIGVSPGNSYFDDTREPGRQYEYELVANGGTGQSSSATVVTE